jgi:putative lipoic acid-binding regulatory protein
MVVAVESVLEEQIPKAQISHKVSSKGKYVSVKIGPIPVVSSEQVTNCRIVPLR